MRIKFFSNQSLNFFMHSDGRQKKHMKKESLYPTGRDQNTITKNIKFLPIFLNYKNCEFFLTGHLSLRRTSSHKIRRRTATVVGGYGPGDDNTEATAEMSSSIRKSRNLLGPSSNMDYHRNMRFSQRSFDGTVGSSLLVLPSQGSTGRRKSFIHHQVV